MIQKCHHLLKMLIKNGSKQSGKLWSDKSKVKILFGKHGCSVLCTKKVGDHPACFLVACNHLLSSYSVSFRFSLSSALCTHRKHIHLETSSTVICGNLQLSISCQRKDQPAHLPAHPPSLHQLLDSHQLPTNYLHSLLTQVKLLITIWISHMNHIPV